MSLFDSNLMICFPHLYSTNHSKTAAPASPSLLIFPAPKVLTTSPRVVFSKLKRCPSTLHQAEKSQPTTAGLRKTSSPASSAANSRSLRKPKKKTSRNGIMILRELEVMNLTPLDCLLPPATSPHISAAAESPAAPSNTAAKTAAAPRCNAATTRSATDPPTSEYAPGRP